MQRERLRKRNGEEAIKVSATASHSGGEDRSRRRISALLSSTRRVWLPYLQVGAQAPACSEWPSDSGAKLIWFFAATSGLHGSRLVFRPGLVLILHYQDLYLLRIRRL